MPDDDDAGFYYSVSGEEFPSLMAKNIETLATGRVKISSEARTIAVICFSRTIFPPRVDSSCDVAARSRPAMGAYRASPG